MEGVFRRRVARSEAAHTAPVAIIWVFARRICFAVQREVQHLAILVVALPFLYLRRVSVHAGQFVLAY